MGQRTAIVVQRYDKESNKKETRVFYCQWGIGRIMPAQLLSIINATILVSSYSSNFVDLIKPQGTVDVTDDYNEEELDVSFSDASKIGVILKGASNNNGGIFVRITTSGKYKEIEKIEYAYMLGHEEGGRYDKFCKEETWMKKAGYGYIDEEFLKMYNATIKYYGATETLK